MKSFLFYAGQLVQEWDAGEYRNLSQYTHSTWGSEIYNGGYLWHGSLQEWYRCDLTPVLLEDVPKELLMLKLLLT